MLLSHFHPKRNSDRGRRISQGSPHRCQFRIHAGSHALDYDRGRTFQTRDEILLHKPTRTIVRTLSLVHQIDIQQAIIKRAGSLLKDTLRSKSSVPHFLKDLFRVLITYIPFAFIRTPLEREIRINQVTFRRQIRIIRVFLIISLIIRLIISRATISIDHSEISLHTHRARQGIQEMLEILHRLTDSQGFSHQVSLLIHLLYIIVFQVIRSRIHDREARLIASGPHGSLRIIAISQPQKTIATFVKITDMVIRSAGIPVFPHQRTAIGSSLSSDYNGGTSLVNHRKTKT